MTQTDLFCSLIPGPNASSFSVTTGFTVLSAVGDDLRIMVSEGVDGSMLKACSAQLPWSHEIGRSRQHHRTGRNTKAVRSLAVIRAPPVPLSNGTAYRHATCEARLLLACVRRRFELSSCRSVWQGEGPTL